MEYPIYYYSIFEFLVKIEGHFVKRTVGRFLEISGEVKIMIRGFRNSLWHENFHQNIRRKKLYIPIFCRLIFKLDYFK